ncbi:hypothetical protein KXV64_000436 [Aspergillus fumigatus]|nr:hypothetical protein KXX42_007982 [Aspergillus fumigatus]KAH3535562.1 hypothetical protein KXV64_000436 [Aspergillus fumigatus]
MVTNHGMDRSPSGVKKASARTRRPKACLRVLQHGLHTKRALCSPPTWSSVRPSPIVLGTRADIEPDTQDLKAVSVPLLPKELHQGPFAMKGTYTGGSMCRDGRPAHLVESALEHWAKKPPGTATLHAAPLASSGYRRVQVGRDQPSPGPSSPDMRIQQAIASLDFTALHAEALSLNYMAAPFPSPPPELEFISTGQASSEVQPSTPSDRRNLEPMSSSQSARWTAPDEARNPSPRHTPPRWQNAGYDGPDSILVPDEDILTLGPMFDPLWDPVVTKTAAINGEIDDQCWTLGQMKAI